MEEIKKTCKKCGESKLIENFVKDKQSKDGHYSKCKLCCKKYMDEYAPKYRNKEENKVKQKEYDKNRYSEKREEILERKKEYHIENREIILEKKAIYRNKEENKKKMKNWRQNNKPLLADLQKNYRDKYPHIIAWRSILYSTLKRLGTEKQGHTIDMLGYSALELKEYIEKLFFVGMSWENHGDWHIDHIIPVTAFDKNTPVHIVCALENLQPLWATTREIDGMIYEGNLNKLNKYNV